MIVQEEEFERRYRAVSSRDGRFDGRFIVAVTSKRVVAALRARGEEVPGEYLAHLSPLEWEHVTLTGVYRWDLDGPVAVGADGFRPLRQPV